MNQGANICKKNKRVVPLDMNFAYVVIWGRSSHMDGDNSVLLKIVLLPIKVAALPEVGGGLGERRGRWGALCDLSLSAVWARAAAPTRRHSLLECHRTLQTNEFIKPDRTSARQVPIKSIKHR